MSVSFLDAIATAYALIKKNTYMLLLWPSANGSNNKFNDVLLKYGSVVYQKDVFLTDTGKVRLVSEVYKNENWVGSKKDGFSGARNKARWCFSENGPLKVFLFESDGDLIKMKDEIRSLYNIDKHAIHINDTQEETIDLTGLLFNENSINWLNYAAIRSFSWYNRLFKHYSEWLDELASNSDYFCIDGSTVLAAYGIREARDLDYFYFGKNTISSGFKEIGCHNNEIQHHKKSIDDIIFNPENHFRINNLKFISLKLINEMKIARNESKDVKDVLLIKRLLSNEENIIPILERIKQYVNIAYLKSRIKFIFLKIRYFYTKHKFFSYGPFICKIIF